MPDLDKLKELECYDLHRLIDYIRAVIVWKQRPEMCLEPMPITNGDGWSYTYAKESEENTTDN